MSSYFERLPLEAAEQMEGLSRLAFELRENRKALLRQYGVEDEAGLLERIRAGAVAEHPAYDHYLGARILEQTREAVRAELQVVIAQLGG